MNKQKLVFANLFKKYRLRSEIETLAEFADLLANEGMSYAVSLFTRWQNGQRVPTDRRALLAMIKIFVRRGGINSVDEANELLECLDMRDLKGDEIEVIQSGLSFSIKEDLIDPNKYYFNRNKYINTFINIYKFIIDKHNLIVIVIFFLLSLIWYFIGIDFRYYIGNTYAITALVGAIFAFNISYKLGGLKTPIGKSLLFLGLGLLGQIFGQVFYAYYIVIRDIQIPYPSLGDIGYLGTIPFYIVGVIYLARALGVKISLVSYNRSLNAIILPVLILGITYGHLLADYNFITTPLLNIILDFGYPFGQSLYISIAILVLSLSKNIFGKMKFKIRFIVLALIAQYVADYVFIYQAHRGIWINGGINDYIYCVAYSLMALAISQFYNMPSLQADNSHRV